MEKRKFYFKEIPDLYNIGLTGILKFKYTNGCIIFREDFSINELINCFNNEQLIKLKQRIDYHIELKK